LAFKGWLITEGGLIQCQDLEVNSWSDIGVGEISFVPLNFGDLKKIRRNCHDYARRNPGVKFATRITEDGLRIVRVA